MRKIALNIRPFVRLIWKNQEARALWAPRLTRISRMYSTAEWDMTKLGYRKAATAHITSNNMWEVLNKVEEDGMVFSPIAKSAYYEGFSHTHIHPQEGEPYFIYGALAKDKETALAFKHHSSDRELVHLELGKLLGYPECCINAFNQRWKEGKIDPMWDAALATEGATLMEKGGTSCAKIKVLPECNQLLRYFGARITSHLPCSFSCKETARIGANWVKVMRRIDREALEWLLELLSLPLTWDAYRGILQVSNKLFLGITTTGYTDSKFVIEAK
jgi:hypothetical protein